MKASRVVVCAAALAAAAWSAGAEENTGKTPPKHGATAVSKAKANTQAPKTELSKATGSYIPQKTKVRGHIAVTASQLVVIDSEMIQRSGASDVGDLLRRGGWASVRR